MVYLDEPEITEADIEAVVKTLRAGWISTAHKTVWQFEEAAKNFLGVPDCVATNSGTSALHLALLACGAGPGVKVIVPALSFVATANAVKYTGADIQFVDVDQDSWTIFGRGFYGNDFGKAKIIAPVFLYGGNENILYVQGENEHRVVWDFAEAWGLKPGYISPNHYYCYSLNGNKTITAGGGGLIAGSSMTDNIRLQVQPRSFDGLGYNYRMPALNAALALSQLESVMKHVNRKREIAKIYKALLPNCRFQKGVEDGIVWMVAALFPEEISVHGLQKRLALYGIPTRRVFQPLNHYAHLKDGRVYPNAEYIYNNGLCLPSSVKNSDKDIEFVCRTIKELCFV